MEKNNTLPVSAWSGYAPESMIRELLLAMAQLRPARLLDPETVRRDVQGQFQLAGKGAAEEDPAVIRSLGATAYTLLMGVPLVGDQVPSIPPRKCSRTLDALLHRCLSADSKLRPSWEELAREAAALEVPRRMKGEFVPEMADDSFWKEEML